MKHCISYTIHAMTQRRECRGCGPVDIDIDGPIETTAETLADDITLAADDEAEANGWKSGYCSHCAWERRRELRDQHRADFPASEAA